MSLIKRVLSLIGLSPKPSVQPAVAPSRPTPAAESEPAATIQPGVTPLEPTVVQQMEDLRQMIIGGLAATGLSKDVDHDSILHGLDEMVAMSIITGEKTSLSTAAGILFGDAMASDLGWQWGFYRDAQGTALVIHDPTKGELDMKAFPIDAIHKRLSSGERFTFGQVRQSLVGAAQAMIAKYQAETA